MAKTTGLSCTVTVDDNGGTGRDISNDVTNFDFATPRGVIEDTGVDKTAMERLLALSDFSITLNGTPNFSANQQHAVFSTTVSGTVTRTTVVALASATATMTAECLYNEYSITRDDAAKMTWQAQGSLANGTAAAWT